MTLQREDCVSFLGTLSCCSHLHNSVSFQGCSGVIDMWRTVIIARKYIGLPSSGILYSHLRGAVQSEL